MMMNKRIFMPLLLVLLLVLSSSCAVASDEPPSGGMLFTDIIGGYDDYQTPTPFPHGDTMPPVKPAETGEPVETDEPAERVELLISAAGDVTLGGNRRGNPSTTPYLREFSRQGNDYGFAFRNVRDILSQDDVTIVNFEGTLTNSTNGNGNEFQFRVDPSHAQVLTLGSVEMVTLENNHMMDFGQAGLVDTIAALDAAGIPWARRYSRAEYTVKGVTVGLLAYQTFGGLHDQIRAQLPGDIAEARKTCDVVIVYYHWGAEMDYAPNGAQISLGRATVDAGADLVLGSHSHRINPIELYNGRYIVYSLSNFSFSGNSKPSDMRTFLFQIKLLAGGGQPVEYVGMRIVPMSISSSSDTNDFAPRPYASGSSAAQGVVDRMIKEGANLKYGLKAYKTEWD